MMRVKPMGDIIGSIFGTSATTSQTTQPDAVSSALNQERLNQLINLFQSGSLRQLVDPQPGLYSPTGETRQLTDRAVEIANTPLDYSNLMSLDDYQRSFDPVTQTYQGARTALDQTTADSLAGLDRSYAATRGGIDAQRQAGLERSYGDYDSGVGGAGQAYRQGTADVDARYNAAIQRGDFDLARSIALSESGGNRALDINQANYTNALNRTSGTTNEILGLNDANFQRGLNLNDSGLLRSLALSGADTQRSLATQDANRARALELGIGATGNYVDQIARPRLEQALALQGLERGGAVPAAIANAVAEYSMPYLQGIETNYGTNQANTLNALTALRGQLTGDTTQLNAAMLNNLMELQTATGNRRAELENALSQQFMELQGGTANQMATRNTASANQAQAQNAALSGQRVAGQTDLASGYQSNVGQLAQALMANNISLEQAGIAANSALGQQLIQAQTTLRNQQQQGITSLANTYGSNAANFAQSLPGASTALTMAPLQARAGQSAILSGLQPLMDFPRQLQEADFLRRQGLFTTAYTGIPYTPGGTVAGSSGTGNIFDQLGGTISSGVTGGQGGFSSLGTKT